MTKRAASEKRATEARRPSRELEERAEEDGEPEEGSESEKAGETRGAASPVKPGAKPAAKKGPAAYEETDWDDETVQSGGQFLPRYSAKAGCRDRIRLMTKPARIAVHWNNNLQRYANCTGDPATCPACEEWGEDTASRKFVAGIVHISRSKGDSREDVGKAMKWVFGADKFSTIRDEVLPALSEMDPPRKLLETDLIVGCSDSKLQKLNFMPATKNLFSKAHRAAWEEAKPKWEKLLDEGFTPEAVRADMKRASDVRNGGGGGGGSRRGRDEDLDDEFAEDRGEDRPRGSGKRRDDRGEGGEDEDVEKELDRMADRL